MRAHTHTHTHTNIHTHTHTHKHYTRWPGQQHTNACISTHWWHEKHGIVIRSTSRLIRTGLFCVENNTWAAITVRILPRGAFHVLCMQKAERHLVSVGALIEGRGAVTSLEQPGLCEQHHDRQHGDRPHDLLHEVRWLEWVLC
jgi:hypothetical protein